MMFVHNKDLDNLIAIEQEVRSASMNDAADTLKEIIDRLCDRREKDNEKIKLYYREKRKIDKNYGRSKKST